MRNQLPPLAGGSLDRDAMTRLSPEALAAARADSRARELRLRGGEVPVVWVNGQPKLSLLAVHAEPQAGGEPVMYLGRVEDAPVFAVPANGHGVPEETWHHPFTIAEQLDDTDRQLLTVASSLARWHESAGFSPRDGSQTQLAQGGWARTDATGVEHFPRTDPAVIVLVEHDDRVLLGSNVLWETGRFSLLAGFVEAGESLEQAVLREVYEEAGVRLDEVEYVASQPWPFPRSLMLGFRARLAAGADPERLVPDPTEISELRWFTREELQHPAPSFSLPGPVSIARWLIDRWVAEGDTGGV